MASTSKRVMPSRIRIRSKNMAIEATRRTTASVERINLRRETLSAVMTSPLPFDHSRGGCIRGERLETSQQQPQDERSLYLDVVSFMRLQTLSIRNSRYKSFRLRSGFVVYDEQP